MHAESHPLAQLHIRCSTLRRRLCIPVHYTWPLSPLQRNSSPNGHSRRRREWSRLVRHKPQGAPRHGNRALASAETKSWYGPACDGKLKHAMASTATTTAPATQAQPANQSSNAQQQHSVRGEKDAAATRCLPSMPWAPRHEGRPGPCDKACAHIARTRRARSKRHARQDKRMPKSRKVSNRTCQVGAPSSPPPGGPTGSAAVAETRPAMAPSTDMAARAKEGANCGVHRDKAEHAGTNVGDCCCLPFDGGRRDVAFHRVAQPQSSVHGLRRHQPSGPLA